MTVFTDKMFLIYQTKSSILDPPTVSSTIHLYLLSTEICRQVFNCKAGNLSLNLSKISLITIFRRVAICIHEYEEK